MNLIPDILRSIAAGHHLRGLPWSDLAVLLVIAASADGETGTVAVTGAGVAEAIGRPSCVLLADRSLQRLRRRGLLDVVKYGNRLSPTSYRLTCPASPERRKARQ